ncbi:N-acetyl-1-D-myo-inositol-2-amino-2-deoxy-alpha-D-glucopyranoside deacetylase [Corynebacterium sp. zg254]|uniref:1D-myo-inositol 2-acetamido-2-deoxy-alpha-D-glucopyranoside deacetylase n=1 Tax=Corynebacterium zhongnanshanii TaxID=2768834 RepID=A0ABQ6VFH8_9CORY|nr:MULTISPECIES: N-acetyl-1-D-myo-inositol-2-amino-2-deoxy-alpha-D-glucopyranoside deacetylase [Corynebacterium]KAB3523169.1 N-acetyl-1-D-myo-inositol-2-amino-2-deoxy-alpha-D-glucopyranoside deacetylase [Corynebacterium zhongnanshanii]MCR5913724.1 N-acetyl-1-D-myo-inositol-2-amino-2-deoxy-alpha-D-glucopyranoside deacetylase [Corynebacterium sp. zg254]
MTGTDNGSTPTIVAVHAHPDDEAIWTGLALAKAVRLGAKVINVTCTLGEEGEVIGDELARLVTDAQRPDGTGLLGGYRIAELQRALTSLGIDAGPVFLGGVGRWRDSGMEGTPSIEHPRAFAHVDNFDEEVQQLAQLLEELRPDIVITYATDGGYGHPDHKRAHRVTHAAVERLEAVMKPRQILWCVSDRQAIDDGLAGVSGSEIPEGWRFGEVAAADHSEVDFTIHGTSQDVAAKAAAMADHATQVVVDGPVFALSNQIVQPLLDTEAYTVAFTAPGEDRDYAQRFFEGEAATDKTAETVTGFMTESDEF